MKTPCRRGWTSNGLSEGHWGSHCTGERTEPPASPRPWTLGPSCSHFQPSGGRRGSGSWGASLPSSCGPALHRIFPQTTRCPSCGLAFFVFLTLSPKDTLQLGESCFSLSEACLSCSRGTDQGSEPAAEPGTQQAHRICSVN